MVSTTHARDLNPHHVGARHRLRAPQRLGRRWTDAFQTRAAPSRSGEWAASMLYTTMHRTTGVDARNDVTRPLVCVSFENARDSRSTRAMVIHLKASETVRHSVATGVANGTAQSGQCDRLAALFQKVREFDQPAKSATILAKGCRDEHHTCTRLKSAPCWCSALTACSSTTRPTLDRRFSNSRGTVAKRHMGGFHALYDCASHGGCQ
jgi:hypothetical protein